MGGNGNNIARGIEDTIGSTNRCIATTAYATPRSVDDGRRDKGHMSIDHSRCETKSGIANGVVLGGVGKNIAKSAASIVTLKRVGFGAGKLWEGSLSQLKSHGLLSSLTVEGKTRYNRVFNLQWKHGIGMM